MEAINIRISKRTHKRLTDLAWKNQSYGNLINEMLDRYEHLFDLNDINEEYESLLENNIKEDNLNMYESDEEFINVMGVNKS